MYISDMVALLRETTWLKVISPNNKDDLRVTAATCKNQTCANGKGRMRDETCLARPIWVSAFSYATRFSFCHKASELIFHAFGIMPNAWKYKLRRNQKKPHLIMWNAKK